MFSQNLTKATYLAKMDEYSAKHDQLSDLYYIKVKKPQNVPKPQCTPVSEFHKDLSVQTNTLAPKTNAAIKQEMVGERQTHSLPKPFKSLVNNASGTTNSSLTHNIHLPSNPYLHKERKLMNSFRKDEQNKLVQLENCSTISIREQNISFQALTKDHAGLIRINTQPKPSVSSPKISELSQVNVSLLKEQYQQKYDRLACGQGKLVNKIQQNSCRWENCNGDQNTSRHMQTKISHPPLLHDHTHSVIQKSRSSSQIRNADCAISNCYNEQTYLQDFQPEQMESKNLPNILHQAHAKEYRYLNMKQTESSIVPEHDLPKDSDGFELLSKMETSSPVWRATGSEEISVHHIGDDQNFVRNFNQIDIAARINNSADAVTHEQAQDVAMENKSDLRHQQNAFVSELQKKQTRIQLQQNPHTRQLFGIARDKVYQPKSTLFRNHSELSGSYASLECPSPPGPPICLAEQQKDPRSLLTNYLKKWYQELSFKEPVQPSWAIPVPPGTLCAARLELDLRLSSTSHGISDVLSVEQILVPIQTKDGNILEAPRRCVIECPTWISSSNLCLRILYSWIKEPPWPPKSTPVAFILYIPLRELKRSIAYYIEKEILPKGSLSPFANTPNGFTEAWSALETLGPKLLIILDGFCNQKMCKNGIKTKAHKACTNTGAIHKHHYPEDVRELLDGKLFPEARLIITTNSYNCAELMPLVQRHIIYEGLTWGKSASILSGGEWKGSSLLLETVQENVHLRQTVRTPLGCLAVATIYETLGSDLPVDELDVIESMINCVAPAASTLSISELGRYCLFCLKMKKTYMTIAEIRMYCSTPEAIMDCLERHTFFGKTAKKRSEYMFNAIFPNMIEFFAANYIASLADRPCLLAAEIAGMAVGDELDPRLLKVLKFSMALLGEQAHVLLSRLTPLWLSPQTIFTLALAGGHNLANLAALCDIMGISKHPPISPLETKPLWVQVRSMPTDLMGWGMALKSPTCTLKNLEVVYQLEKQTLSESKNAVDIFIDSMSLNESVSTLRFSSLIEMDVKDSEINYMANCVSRLLLKPRLENFELILTLIEEDPPMLKLQAVIVAICKTIHLQSKLSSLLLDLGLCSSQLVQLCSALEKCPNITRLSLPHLRCDRGAIAALSSLLNTRPLSFLALPSCWGARDDPPSSSGVSMGSGSGSSTGTSCLIKQGSLPGVPSPRSYAPGIFSSLPRGILAAQTSIGRSATLPRQPLEQNIEKRSCDSVVSKTWYPTPACDGGPHNSGTLHDLFAVIRDSYSRLYGLDLSKAQLSLEDSMCLGETVRISNTLHTLKLEGASRVSEVLPTILGASESPCLQMLSLGSQRLNIEDTVTVMCTRALANCSTLRLLSIDGWCFRIEHVQTLLMLRAFLATTSIRELSLSNCRLQTGLVKADMQITNDFVSKSVVVLKLGGAQIILPNLTILRGPQLLQYIGCFPYLRELDLSAPPRSGIESTHCSPLILDNKSVIQFFQKLHTHFRLLNTLKICNWIIHFDEFAKTLKQISKIIRNSSISFLKLDGISVLDRAKKQRNEAAFIRCFISSLPQLRWLGISLSGKKEEQISEIANSVSELRSTEIEMKLSESTIDQAKSMAQVISLDGKFDIKVSTFGTSSVILIHAIKCGVKSLTRRHKENE